MSKYREEYMQSLTDRIIEINKKEVLTEDDKILILRYKKELANYEYVPATERIMRGIDNIYKKIRSEIVKGKGDKTDGV